MQTFTHTEEDEGIVQLYSGLLTVAFLEQFRESSVS